MTEKLSKKSQALDQHLTKIRQPLDELRSSFTDLEWKEDQVQAFLQRLEQGLDQVLQLTSLDL